MELINTAIFLIFLSFCRGMSIGTVDERLDTRSLKTKRQSNSDFSCATLPTSLDGKTAGSRRASQGVIYVNSAHPVTCSGRVDTIETCFNVDDNIPGDFAMDVVVLRPIPGGYAVQEVLDLPTNDLTESDNTGTGNVLYCQNITVPSTLTVQSGDLLGFSVKSSIIVAFTEFTFEGSLRSVMIQPSLGRETVFSEQLMADGTTPNELPMFRGLIVADGSTDGEQTTSSPDCPTNGNNADDGGIGGGPDLNFNNIYNTAFSSFVIATIIAIIIIIFLLVALCGMGMSLCKEKYKCLYKICCCCCRKKKKGIIRRVMNV